MNEQVDWNEMARRALPRVPSDLVQQAHALSTATLHEAAGRIGVIPSAIKPLRGDWRLCGPAYTVQGPSGDNLWLHRAIYAARPGDILLVHCSGGHDYGYWGEVMTTAALARGLAGLVIDGGVRDVELLRGMPFPIFSRGISMRGTGKDFAAIGRLGMTTDFEGTQVDSGDLLVGDADGVVVIPRKDVRAVIDASVRRENREIDIMERLRQGETTLSIYGLS